LAFGLTACFVILVYIAYHYSFDMHNKNIDNLYLAISENNGNHTAEPLSPILLAPTIKNRIPGVKESGRFYKWRCKLNYKDKVFDEPSCAFIDPEVFNILTFPIIKGDINKVFTSNDYFVISEKMANKYFGDKSPIGQIISISNYGKNYDVTVATVMKDIPTTSTMCPDFIAPFHIYEYFIASFAKEYSVDPYSWYENISLTFLFIEPSADKHIVENNINEVIKKQYQEMGRSIRLFPVKDIHMHSSDWLSNIFPTGDISKVKIYSAAAGLILFLACVNYVLLSLGRAGLRKKEIGVKRILGAQKRDLFFQVVTESVIVAVLSLPIAVILLQISLSSLTSLLGTEITGSFFHQWYFVAAFLLITILVGLIAGSYLALYLSRLNPIEIIRNKFGNGKRKLFFRRTMIVTQMVIFVGLIASSVTIYNQLYYVTNAGPGYDVDHLFVLSASRDFPFFKNYEAFKNECKNNPSVINVSTASILPGSIQTRMGSIRKKEDPVNLVRCEGTTIDNDFIETMGIQMVAGQSFKQRNSINGSRDCIINEAAAKALNITENPIGQMLSDRSVIIGVVKDFHLHSMREKTIPLIMGLGPEYMPEVVIKLKPESEKAAIEQIRNMSAKYNNNKPMEAEPFHERLGSMYDEEQNIAKVITITTCIAIIIACLGIWGMVLMISQQMVKEVGIRKVLGASARNIYMLFAKEYFFLLLASAAIAFPVSNYFMNIWLQNFAYRINVGPAIWISSFVIGALIVCGTISFQVFKSARMNPVDSIKNE
jgi:putative ABC transport system permease protein